MGPTARQCSAVLELSKRQRKRRCRLLPTRQSLPQALTLGMDSRFALSTGEARCALCRPLSNVPDLIQGSRLQAPPPKPKAQQRKDDSSASESCEHSPDGDEVAAVGKEPFPVGAPFWRS